MRKKPTSWIPALIAILLILIICLGTGVGYLADRYSLSKDRADLYALYNLEEEDDAVVFVNNLYISLKGKFRQDEAYLPVSYVTETLNKRVYIDEQERLLLYTLPDGTVRIPEGTALSEMTDWAESAGKSAPVWYEDGGTFYISCTLIREYTDIHIEDYEDPGRIYIDSAEATYTCAEVKKDTQVRRAGGVKSDIVADVPAGSTVIILDAMDDWSQVRTEDGYIGYLQNKRLTDSFTEQRTSDFAAPVWTSITRDHDICLVWHQVFNMDGNAGLESALAQAEGVNTISPTWLSVADNEGNLTSLCSSSYVETAHAMGLEVWVLVDNFSTDMSTYEVLSRTSTRTALINNLMAEIRACGADGINVDFESLTEAAAPHFLQFLRELSVACRQEGIVLSVDNYVPTSSTAYYDRAEQGAVADYVIIMGYDEHWRSSDAGSTASLPFVQAGIENTLAEVPQRKVINALPFYTRVWGFDASAEIPEDADPNSAEYVISSSAVGMVRAKTLLEDAGAELAWDSELGQYYGEYEEDGTLYRIWLEDAESLEQKLNLTASYDLAGVAFWKLGLESDDVWPLIGAYMGVETEAEASE